MIQTDAAHPANLIVTLAAALTANPVNRIIAVFPIHVGHAMKNTVTLG
jgi:hypothetical protein